MRARAPWLALAVAALLGCGTDRDAPLTISASVVGREGEILERQLRRFEALHPGVRVAIRRTPDDATQRHQLYVQWLNARLGDPDVVQLDVIWTPEFAAAGWVDPMPITAEDAADFFPATLDANRWRGRLWAVPWFVDVGMLYWRTDLLPCAPQSLHELARHAAAAIREGAVSSGFVWQGARYEGLVTVYLEILTAHGGSILDASGRPALRSREAVAALEFLRSLIANGVSPAEVLTWHEEETRFAFQNGRAALMRNWPYAVPLLEDESASRVAGRFAVAPMPA
ncbi:MAG: extracellular solute-binding protein, partial [Thermoanaerobaculia bacterium]